MLKQRVIKTIQETGVISIARGIDVETVVPVARALLKGGIRVFEVTCNTAGVMDSIKILKKEFGSDMWIGAGTVTNPVLAQLVLDAGADFVLAPNFDPDVIMTVHERCRLMIPSVTTPTEVVKAHRLGVDLLKLFPASGLGPAYLKDLRGPFENAALIPVGGISLDTIEAFVKAGAIAVGTGSQLLKKSFIENRQWDALTEEAAKYVTAFKAHKNS